jgi:hypothetical protein
MLLPPEEVHLMGEMWAQMSHQGQVVARMAKMLGHMWHPLGEVLLSAAM